MKPYTEYPTEVFSALTKTKTFSVTAEFTKANPYATEEDRKPDAPLKAYDSTFSRFVLTIIDKQNGEKGFKTGNINVPEIPALVNATEIARQQEALANSPVARQIQSTVTNVETGIDKVMKNLSYIYYHIKNGKPKPRPEENRQQETDALIKAASEPLKILKSHKGQTPLQILKDDPSQKDHLLDHKKFLEDNLEKYQGNRPQIEAIDAAVKLLEMGNIADVAAGPSTAGVIPIYKPSPRPLIRKKNEETGLCPVKEISIDWHLGDNSPVEVTILTYDAPVKQNDSGMVMPEKSKAVNSSSYNFRMSDIQWSNCIYNMQLAMRRFEDSVRDEQLADAETISLMRRLSDNEKIALPERWFAEIATTYHEGSMAKVNVQKYLALYGTGKDGKYLPIPDRRKKSSDKEYDVFISDWHSKISEMESSLSDMEAVAVYQRRLEENKEVNLPDRWFVKLDSVYQDGDNVLVKLRKYRAMYVVKDGRYIPVPGTEKRDEEKEYRIPAANWHSKIQELESYLQGQ